MRAQTHFPHFMCSIHWYTLLFRYIIRSQNIPNMSVCKCKCKEKVHAYYISSSYRKLNFNALTREKPLTPTESYRSCANAWRLNLKRKKLSLPQCHSHSGFTSLMNVKLSGGWAMATSEQTLSPTVHVGEHQEASRVKPLRMQMVPYSVGILRQLPKRPALLESWTCCLPPAPAQKWLWSVFTSNIFKGKKLRIPVLLSHIQGGKKTNQPTKNKPKKPTSKRKKQKQQQFFKSDYHVC